MFFALAGQALLSGLRSMNEAKAQNTINKANTWIANLERKTSNERSGAIAALQTLQQSVQNNDFLRESGKQVEKLNQQYVELGRQMTTGGLQQRLAAAAQTGALAASAGAAGVGGGSIDALNATLNLTSDIGQSEVEKTYNNQIFQLEDAVRENTYQQYNGLNNNLYQADLRVADIIGPAKLDGSFQTAALEAGASFLGNLYQVGTFSKGGALDVSRSSGGFRGLLSRAFGGSAPSTTGSNFKLGARLL